MLRTIKKYFEKLSDWVESTLFCEETTGNTYCFPCTWTISGRVYVSAPDVEIAKSYVKTQKIAPVMEECLSYRAIADIDHPILCICGNCDKEYVVSPLHNPVHCPYCGNGGEVHELHH